MPDQVCACVPVVGCGTWSGVRWLLTRRSTWTALGNPLGGFSHRRCAPPWVRGAAGAALEPYLNHLLSEPNGAYFTTVTMKMEDGGVSERRSLRFRLQRYREGTVHCHSGVKGRCLPLDFGLRGSRRITISGYPGLTSLAVTGQGGGFELEYSRDTRARKEEGSKR